MYCKFLCVGHQPNHYDLKEICEELKDQSNTDAYLETRTLEKVSKGAYIKHCSNEIMLSWSRVWKRKPTDVMMKGFGNENTAKIEQI